MDCPNCKTELTSTDSNGIVTSSCESCNGIWISAKALEILFKLEGIQGDFPNFYTNSNLGTSARKCPICFDQYLSINMIKDVEIDSCDKGHGIFLDQYEIEKLIPQNYKSIYKEQRLKDILLTDGIFALLVVLFGG